MKNSWGQCYENPLEWVLNYAILIECCMLVSCSQHGDNVTLIPSLWRWWTKQCRQNGNRAWNDTEAKVCKTFIFKLHPSDDDWHV